MKLALATTHQILVELSAEEQLRFGLTADGDLRGTLRRILAGVASVSGRCFRPQPQVRLDLLPDRVGGCLLIISGLEEQAAAGERCCFFAQTENDLIDAARAAETGDDVCITLLKGENGYYLLTPPLPERQTRLLSEFMRFTRLDEAAEAVLLERCALLARDLPLSALRGGA